MFNPIMTLSTMLVKFVVRRINLPSLFIELSKDFLYLARSFVINFGLFPTLAAARIIQLHMIQGTSRRNFPSSIPGVPSVIAQPMLALIQPYWGDCLANATKMSPYFRLMRIAIFLSSFGGIITSFIRILFGLFISLFGISFCPDGLFYFSDFFKPIFRGILRAFNFVSDVPSVSQPINQPLPVVVNTPSGIQPTEASMNYVSWSMLGMLLGGFVLSSIGIGIVQHNFPLFFDHIPFIGEYITNYGHHVNTVEHTIWRWLGFNSNGSYNPGDRDADVNSSSLGITPPSPSSFGDASPTGSTTPRAGSPYLPQVGDPFGDTPNW